MPATIRDVAHLAGVSVSAVSKVVTNADNSIRVSDETRQRIQQAIKKLHYRPSIRARSLHSGRAQMIGLISDRDTFIVPYAYLVSERSVECLLKRGYVTTALLYRRGDDEALARIADVIDERRCDGLLLMVEEEERIRAAAAARAVPTVTINPAEAHPYDSVIFDEFDNVRLAFTCLRDAGCRRIGYVDFTKQPARHATVMQRRAAYLRLCHAQAVTPQFLSEDYAEIDAARTPRDLRMIPEGIITYNDTIAQKLISRIYRNRAIDPRRFNIVSAATDMFLDRMPLRISGVALPIEAMAEAAVDMLLRRIEHGGQHVKTTSIAGVLSMRESVHPLRTARRKDMARA